jgi:hypothetical protein
LDVGAADRAAVAQARDGAERDIAIGAGKALLISALWRHMFQRV